MAHLFISHSTRDGGAIAQQLAAALEAAGHRCWIAPRDVKPGVPYPGQIVAAIRDCAGLVLIVTPAANESPDVLQEVQLAGQNRKTVAPVIVGGAKPSDDLHYFIGVRHQIGWLDAKSTCNALLPSFPPPANEIIAIDGRNQRPALTRPNDLPVNMAASSPGETSGIIVAIASGKGGVGKTWLAITLAACFANLGKRTLLVDASRGLSSVEVHLGFEAKADITSAITGPEDLAKAMTVIPSNAAGDRSFDTALLRREGFSAGTTGSVEVAHSAFSLRLLRSRYDLVIVDLDSGVQESVMNLARSSDVCLVVANDQPTAMTDAFAFMKALRGYAPKASPMVVINSADSQVAGWRTYSALSAACRQVLDFEPPFAGVILRDASISIAIRQNQLLTVLDPEGEAVQRVMAIAQRVLAPSTSVDG